MLAAGASNARWALPSGVGLDAVLRLTCHRFSWSPTASSNQSQGTSPNSVQRRDRVWSGLHRKRVLVQDIDTTRVTLAELKDAGLQVAIDDSAPSIQRAVSLSRFPRPLRSDRDASRPRLQSRRARDVKADHSHWRGVRPQTRRRGSRPRRLSVTLGVAPRVRPRARIPVVPPVVGENDGALLAVGRYPLTFPQRTSVGGCASRHVVTQVTIDRATGGNAATHRERL